MEVLNGDGMDGQALVKKAHWNMGPYHRQGQAHYLRAAGYGKRVVYPIGNHEHGLEVGDGVVKYDSVRGEALIKVGEEHKPHRNLIGKSIYGVEFTDKFYYTDPNGEEVEIEHGHVHDMHLFKTISNRDKAYSIGNTLLDIAVDADEFFQKQLNKEDLSIAGWVKSRFKDKVNKNLGIRDAMSADLDAHPTARRKIYGHSHMGGFQFTPGGKVLMNDGCCTDHVQALVHDADGTWALITWHKDRMDVAQEDGQEYRVYWKELGAEMGVNLSHFSEPPSIMGDEYTMRADRILRLAYRMWPPQDRKILRESMEQNIKFLSRVEQAVAAGEDVSCEQMHQYFNLAAKVAEFHALPIQRRSIAPISVELAEAEWELAVA